MVSDRFALMVRTLCGSPAPVLPAIPGRQHVKAWPMDGDPDTVAEGWAAANPDEFAQAVASTSRCSDLAALLGVSKQRASQLLQARRAAAHAETNVTSAAVAVRVASTCTTTDMEN